MQVLDGDRLLIFNRHELCAEVLEVALDLDAMYATSVWGHSATPCLVVPMMGQGTRLPDGETLISWSTAGVLDIVRPDGVTVWRLALDLGAAFGLIEHVDQLGL